MNRVSQCSCLRFFLLFVFAFSSPLLGGVKFELPQAVQDKIQMTMEKSPQNSVTVYDKSGNETGSVTVNKSKAQKYGSLADFLKSDESPAKSCKDPVPTPPPPCIICNDGQVVCAKASFVGKPPSPPPAQSQQHPRNAQSEVKGAEGEKPQ
jgi:hypothetical protein